MKVLSTRLTPFRIPFRSPLATGHGVLKERAGALLVIEAEGDLRGHGEVAPLDGFPTESLDEAIGALSGLSVDLVGMELPTHDALDADSQHTRVWRDALTKLGGRRPAARAALDGALLDLAAQGAGVRVCDLLSKRLGVEPRAEVEVNALIGGATPAKAAFEAATAVSKGHRTLKLKLRGAHIAADLERLATVRAAVGEEVRLRVDANGSLTVEQALAIGDDLQALAVEYIEQPVSTDDPGVLARLRDRLPVPIAADESAASFADARRVIEAGAVDIVVLKPSIVGGPRASMALLEAARKASVHVVVTSALESAVGVGAALQLAAALPKRAPACGLATASWLADDLAKPLAIEDGRMCLPEGLGAGVELDLDALERLRSGPDSAVAV